MFDDAARWARYGMECFLGNMVFIGFVFLFPFPTGGFRGLPSDIIVFRAMGCMFLIFPCVFLAWLARVKVVDPLRCRELPKHIRAWCLTLSALGYFFGMVIGLVVMGYADEKIKFIARNLNPKYNEG
jgi:hypothetical protein